MKQNKQRWTEDWQPVGRGDRCQAFSLVEVLVIVAVLALLAALFLPAFHKAKQRAWTTDCDANLQQIGMAMSVFAGDHAAYYPESGGTIYWGATDAQTEKRGWMRQLAPFLGVTNVFNCPGNAQLPRQFQGPFNYFNGCHAAYTEAGGFAAVRNSAIIYPSVFVLGGDTAGTLSKGTGLQFDPLDADKDDATLNCIGGAADDSLTAYWRIHFRGQNVMFVDGHVSWYERYEPDEMTFDYGGIKKWAPVAAH